VTCYDFWSAKTLNETDVDLLLVGDSLAMVVYGHSDTTKATMPMMISHVEAVRRGAPDKFIVGDMPFLSFRKSIDHSLEAAGDLIRAGANAVKLEGALGNLELVERMVGSGIPVMGHLGLTPQFVNAFGGFKVQGKSKEAQAQLIQDALNLEKAGAFSLVLECIPSQLAREVSESLKIPVIGIGAGIDCDGQVLVLHDLMGFTQGKKPKFVRVFAEGAEVLKAGVNQFCEAVREKSYPSVKESYE
jgi:3-methyl-2-oxobutanoate hydroxymethyltransferase